MAIANGYSTGAELATHMGNTRAGFAAAAGTEQAIEAVSRDIDGWCGRRFYKDTDATARTFYATSYTDLAIADAWEVTALTIDGTSVTLGNYEQQPLDGIVDGLEGWPVTRLAIPRDGSSPTAFYRQCVVTAKWGWAAVPKPVKSACLLLSAELLKTGDIPMIDEFSTSTEMKAVYRLLKPYRTGLRAVPVA